MKMQGHECRDRICPKRWCWTPGNYQHRGATMSGSRATGRYTKECLHRANHGCPQPIPEPGDPHPWDNRGPKP